MTFSNIRGLGPFFWFKVLNFSIFGGFQKNYYYWGMKNLWIFLGVIIQLDYIKGSFICILVLLYPSQVQNGGIFRGC